MVVFICLNEDREGILRMCVLVVKAAGNGGSQSNSPNPVMQW